MLPPKWVKGDLHSFHQNVGQLSVFQPNIFLFSNVAPFGYNKSANEGIITFLGKIWGHFPFSTKIGEQGDES